MHLTSGVNVAKLLEDVSTLLGKAKGVTSAGGAATGTAVPTSLTAEQRDVITRSIKSAKVDVWTGAKDRTLRKVAVDVQVDVPEELRAKAGNLQTGHVIFQVTIAQLNQAQKIVKPADARPISELRSTLADARPGWAPAARRRPRRPTPRRRPIRPRRPPRRRPPPARRPTYTQCITDAGEDLAKVQDCAQYLNK